MQEFIIPQRLASLNEYILKCRGNKYSGNTLKKQQEQIIKKAIAASDVIPIKSYPIKIIYKWVEPNKKRDLDNICFAHKFVQDALVESGILTGDGWKQIVSFEDSFEVDKDNPCVKVTILENGEY